MSWSTKEAISDVLVLSVMAGIGWLLVRRWSSQLATEKAQRQTAEQARFERIESAMAGVKCPRCGGDRLGLASKKLTTAGAVVFVLGLILSPFGIGLILALFAWFTMRETVIQCTSCEHKF